MPRQAKERMEEVLAESGKARRLSIELSGMEFANDLSQQLLLHANDMEKTYGQFQKLVKQEVNTEAQYRPLFHLTEKKQKWYASAEASCLSLVTRNREGLIVHPCTS